MTLRPLAVLACVASAALAQDWKPELRNVQIPMQDGKTLAADVYLPDAEGKYPAVLIQTPYNRSSMGAVMTVEGAGRGETARGSTSDMKILMDRKNYAYVVVDWRGFFGSKAALAGVTPPVRRGRDGYDCVEWIAAQPWSNGRVGTWGGSALGKQQLDTALEHPPHLVCCVPLIASMGQAYSDYYENGVMLEGHVKKLDQLGFGVSKQVVAHPGPREPLWTAAERLTFRPAAIDVPCLFITGWWDNYPDRILATFEAIVEKGGERAKQHSRLLIGPWDHVSIGIPEQGDRTFAGAALESAHAAKAFLDWWLRDVRDNGWDKTARVRWWTVNEAAWRSADSWTSLPRKTATLRLSPDGRLMTGRPDEGVRTWRHDPRDAAPTLGGANLPPMKHGPCDHASLEGRKDVLTYASGPLEAPLRLDGRAELAFSFRIDRVDADFVARLCDAGPDGKVVLIAEVAGRVKYRDPAQGAQPAVPGERASIRLLFPSTSVVFPEKHEVVLFLGSASLPRYERNPHTGADHWDEKSALELEVTVFHDDATLSFPAIEEPAKPPDRPK
jgi:hypothetical protein